MARSFLEDVPASRLTESTIKQMFCLVDCGKTDEKFQKLVYGIVGRAMPGQWKDYEREQAVLFDWFRGRHDYRRDPYAVELLHDVWATMDRKRFDCDDGVIWLGAAFETLGAPVRFVTVSTRPDREPSHVYIEALSGGRWIPYDATVKHASPGWEPTEITAKRIWTRSDVGLAGYDTVGIEGLGMNPGQGFEFLEDQSRSFRSGMVPVSQALAPGVPDDISMTYAAHAPGDSYTSLRRQPGDPERRRSPVSDGWENLGPGGYSYGEHLPISSYPTPDEAWFLTDRRGVPTWNDPEKAWWGVVPGSTPEPDAFLPGTRVPKEDYLQDLAGLGAQTDAIVEDIASRVLSGQVGLGEVEDEIEDQLDGLGFGKRHRRRHRRRHRAVSPFGGELEAEIADRMEDALEGLGYYGGLASLDGWIDDVASLAKSVIGAVTDGIIPNTPPAVKSATDTAVDVWAAKKAGTVTTPPGGTPTVVRPPAPPGDGAKWTIPVLVIGGLLAVGGSMGRRRRK